MKNSQHTQRSFLKRTATASTVIALAASGIIASNLLFASDKNGAGSSKKTLYWGDVHSHNAIGYAKGSLERSYDIARNHLDFFCFTGHSQWHDMPKMPQDNHLKWVRGFEVVKNNWAKVTRLANESYEPGKFVSFIGYEWHSSQYGDVCIVFPGSESELVYMNNIKDFQKFARDRGAILIPHHPSYKQGWRGQNWSVLDTTVSPVVEIFSEHGCAESDRSPYRYIRHSMGGRDTRNTLQWLWQQGVQVGVVAIPALTAKGLLPPMPNHSHANPSWKRLKHEGPMLLLEIELNWTFVVMATGWAKSSQQQRSVGSR